MTTTKRPAAGSHSAGVDDIRADIEETRSELGDTVEALAAKTDVKQRAKEAADTAKARVAESAGVAKAKVAESVTTGAHVVQERASELAAKAQQNPRVRQVYTKVSTQVRRRPVPIAAAVGVIVLVVAAVRRRRSR